MRCVGLYFACVAAAIVLACSLPVPHERHTIETFVQQPTDRSVLQTRRAVWDARANGSEYPSEYIDYAAWYVRLD